MASPLDVIKIVLAPAATMFSIAVIWPAVSPSALPEAVSSLAPRLAASACAPSFILTKNGLVSVLVIKPMTGASAAWAAATLSASALKIRVVVLFKLGLLVGMEGRGKYALRFGVAEL